MSSHSPLDSWAIPDTYHAPANAAHVFDRSLLHPLPQPAESRSSETPSLLLVCVSFTSILDQGATEHIRVPRINTYVNRPVLSHIVPADYIFRSCHFPQISSLSLRSVTLSLASLSLQTPVSSSQTRCASILNSLSNNKGAVKNRKRVGRGPSSGHGKTSGRGHKGAGQHGKVKPWFQGGQTSLLVSHGRKGFLNM